MNNSKTPLYVSTNSTCPGESRPLAFVHYLRKGSGVEWSGMPLVQVDSVTSATLLSSLRVPKVDKQVGRYYPME